MVEGIELKQDERLVQGAQVIDAEQEQPDLLAGLGGRIPDRECDGVVGQALLPIPTLAKVERKRHIDRDAVDPQDPLEAFARVAALPADTHLHDPLRPGIRHRRPYASTRHDAG
ncbi:MAG: hypothetical protein ACI9K5_002983 [Gammaproteobacteria bacterium]